MERRSRTQSNDKELVSTISNLPQYHKDNIKYKDNGIDIQQTIRTEIHSVQSNLTKFLTSGFTSPTHSPHYGPSQDYFSHQPMTAMNLAYPHQSTENTIGFSSSPPPYSYGYPATSYAIHLQSPHTPYHPSTSSRHPHEYSGPQSPAPLRQPHLAWDQEDPMVASVTSQTLSQAHKLSSHYQQLIESKIQVEGVLKWQKILDLILAEKELEMERQLSELETRSKMMAKMIHNLDGILIKTRDSYFEPKLDHSDAVGRTEPMGKAHAALARVHQRSISGVSQSEQQNSIKRRSLDRSDMINPTTSAIAAITQAVRSFTNSGPSVAIDEVPEPLDDRETDKDKQADLKSCPSTSSSIKSQKIFKRDLMSPLFIGKSSPSPLSLPSIVTEEALFSRRISATSTSQSSLTPPTTPQLRSPSHAPKLKRRQATTAISGLNELDGFVNKLGEQGTVSKISPKIVSTFDNSSKYEYNIMESDKVKTQDEQGKAFIDTNITTSICDSNHTLTEYLQPTNNDRDTGSCENLVKTSPSSQTGPKTLSFDINSVAAGEFSYRGHESLKSPSTNEDEKASKSSGWLKLWM